MEASYYGEQVMLTNEERLRFIEYLEKDADSSRLLLEQLSKLPAGLGLDKRMRIEMEASLIVAAKLRQLSTETI
jgi:hypothetical protein